MTKEYPTNCTNCGKLFYVNQKCKADSTNISKFVRACSKECTSSLRAKNMKNISNRGIKRRTGPTRELNRDELIRLLCYEYKYLGEVSRVLKIKSTTLSREIKRLNIPQEFYRSCPNCGDTYACKMRCQVNPNSNKFKKFCSHKCFLSSRNKTNTWIELVINAFLTKNEIEFITQYPIGRMTADFYIPSINLVVEANGDFWHANPVVYSDKNSLHPIQIKAIEKDKRKMSQLKSNGYDILVIWENDLKVNLDETLSDLLDNVRSKEAV